MSRFLLNKNFISLIIILIPFLSFVNTNFHSFDSVFFNSVFFILFFVIVAIFLLSKFLSLFLKKLNYEIFNLVLSFVFFILFYLFTFFKESLLYIAPIYSAEISLILSIIFLVLFLFLFFNQKYIFFKRFILIYLSICFIVNLSVFIFNTTIFLSQKALTDASVLIDEKGIEYLKKNKKTNMYFVVVDAAIPLDKFDKHYNTNYFSFYVPKFEKLGFTYVENTNSTYHNTAHSLTSLFYLDYHIDEKNYKKYSLTNLFPVILEKKNADKLALIKNLKKINYKFQWLGNSYNDCRHNLDFCLDDNNKLKKNTLITPYVAKTFLQRSPLIQIYVKSKNFLGLSISMPEYQKENDALNIFMNKNDNFKFKNQGYFFLIHSLIPHWPYTFNSDCTIKKGLEILDEKKIQIEGKERSNNILEAKYYKEQYECMLKRVDEFVNFIDKNDPEANVVIISDHGHNIKDFFILGYDTFALVKKNKECQQNVPDNLNIANGARLILGCTVGQKFGFLEKKLYYVYFQRGDMTIGGKLGLERLDPNNYSEIYERFPISPWNPVPKRNKISEKKL